MPQGFFNIQTVIDWFKPASHSPSKRNSLEHRSVDYSFNENMLTMGGRAFIPICTLCDFDTKKMFLFLVIAAFNFKTCLKAGIWDPCFLKRSESCKAKCILLLRCLLFRTEWVSALRLPPGHLPDRLYIVFILFSPCCPTRLTRICSTSNNIYHLVRQPTATNVMKCYSTEAPVLWAILGKMH